MRPTRTRLAKRIGRASLSEAEHGSLWLTLGKLKDEENINRASGLILKRCAEMERSRR